DQLPFGVGQARRFEALLAARSGDGERAEERFRAAAEMLREISARFYLGVVLLEHGEWFAEGSKADEAEPLLTEAREIFERLGAAPWLERLDALAEPAPRTRTRASGLPPYVATRTVRRPLRPCFATPDTDRRIRGCSWIVCIGDQSPWLRSSSTAATRQYSVPPAA